MFNVTRLAAGTAKFARKTVKNVAKENINISKASKDFKDVYKAISENQAPYSKNIFKRGLVWIQSFVKTFKNMKADMKKAIESKKTELGEAFTKKDKKDVIKEFFAENKEALNDLKAELKSLIESGKKTTKK